MSHSKRIARDPSDRRWSTDRRPWLVARTSSAGSGSLSVRVPGRPGHLPAAHRDRERAPSRCAPPGHRWSGVSVRSCPSVTRTPNCLRNCALAWVRKSESKPEVREAGRAIQGGCGVVPPLRISARIEVIRRRCVPCRLAPVRSGSSAVRTRCRRWPASDERAGVELGGTARPADAGRARPRASPRSSGAPARTGRSARGSGAAPTVHGEPSRRRHQPPTRRRGRGERGSSLVLAAAMRQRRDDHGLGETAGCCRTSEARVSPGPTSSRTRSGRSASSTPTASANRTVRRAWWPQ